MMNKLETPLNRQWTGFKERMSERLRRKLKYINGFELSDTFSVTLVSETKQNQKFQNQVSITK